MSNKKYKIGDYVYGIDITRAGPEIFHGILTGLWDDHDYFIKNKKNPLIDICNDAEIICKLNSKIAELLYE